MLDDRVREVLRRIEGEEPRSPGIPVERTTGQFLFSVVAPQTDCEVLEIGAGRGYSTIWLAAGVRNLGAASSPWSATTSASVPGTATSRRRGSKRRRRLSRETHARRWR